MGIGHTQQSFEKRNWKHVYSHGGNLRQKRAGRQARPLSAKDPLHVVFKIQKSRLRGGLRSPRNFNLLQRVLQQYAQKFFVKIDQVSIQNDHCHLLVRTSRRSNFHFFFRVVAGQMAQRLEKEKRLWPIVPRDPSFEGARVTDTPATKLRRGTGLWKHRPFSRVVRGWRAYEIVWDYIQLNEKEALGLIVYRKERLKGLSSGKWQELWS